MGSFLSTLYNVGLARCLKQNYRVQYSHYTRTHRKTTDSYNVQGVRQTLTTTTTIHLCTTPTL